MTIGLTANQSNPQTTVNQKDFGYYSKDVAGSSNVTLTDNEATYKQIVLTGALTGNISVYQSDAQNVIAFKNSTTGAYTITAAPTAGSGITLRQGEWTLVGYDGAGTAYKLVDETKLRGYVSVDCSGSSDITLTELQENNAQIVATGTLTGNINVIASDSENFFWFYNNTSGAYTVTVQPSGGSGVAVTQGKKVAIGFDGGGNAFAWTAEL